jgi:hypothetical protein
LPKETPKIKSKGRQRKNNRPRDFLCGCGLDYISSSNLKTHIRRKHNNVMPENTVMKAN